MENFIEENKINNWKKLILNNLVRLQQEKEVIQRYGSIFSPTNLDNLTKEDFKSFLLMKNNHHWEGIHRQGNIITEDMDKLRNALKILLDERKNIKDRLDLLFPLGKDGYVKGMGRAIATPILLVVYPDKYGIWNSKSEAGLETLGFLPKFKSKDSFASKYLQINEILTELVNKHNVTLWQLDEIIGCIALGNAPITATENGDLPIVNDGENQIETYEEFGLESHLEDFLIENWNKLDVGKKYNILEEDGDMIGQQYITPVGRIDILAKSKDNKEWLVIELKKGRSGDQVVGQILRYIGWLRKNKANPSEIINGLIILGGDDEKVQYAISSLPNISLMTYSVSFNLNNV